MASADERIVIELDLKTGRVLDQFKKIEGKGSASGKNAGKNFGMGFKAGIGKLDLFVANLQARAAAKSIQLISQAFRASIQDLRDFTRGVAEINSILPLNQKLTNQSRQALIGFSSQFGTGPSEQARAFYNIVSAGVKGTAQQIKALDVANTAAVAGLVDIDSAAKVLVSAVNSYAKSGLTATRASDVLFATVREGQTTFGELTDQVGVVAPLAAAAGLSFENLGGAIAAITKSGVKTDRAIIGLRAILTSILKPSKEAADEAARLGINLNQAAIKGGKFAEFIRDVQKRTNGSADSIAKLFGNVRALTPILQLANSTTGNFEDVLKKTAKSAGDTARAFDIISRSLDFKLKKKGQEFRNFGLQISQAANVAYSEIITNLVPSIGLVQNAVLIVAKILNRGLVPAFELVFNAAKIVFNGIVGGINLIIAGFGKLSSVIGKAFSVFGVKNPLVQGMIDFGDITKKTLDDSADTFKASVDNIFDGSVFGAGEAFISNLENNLAAAKEKIDTSNISVTGGADTSEKVDPSKAISNVQTLRQAIAGLGAGFAATEKDILAGLVKVGKASIFLGQSIKKGIGQGLGSAFGAFGAALASGENALDAFAKSFLGTLGQMMIQQGTMFILQGLGFSVIPGLQASGGTLIAAGAGLAVAGGALSALSGGGAPAASVNASGGGDTGGIATGPDGTGVTEQIQEREEPNTEVSVVIQGDVLDSDASGIRIVDIINNAFEKDGVVIKGASFA